MLRLLFIGISLLFPGTKLAAQIPDSLDCVEKKRLIIESREVSQWQQVLLHYRQSKIVGLHSKTNLFIPQDALDTYDYEWKTSRWQKYQQHIEGNDISRDSLREALDSKSKALKKKFDLLGSLPCKQSLFDEIVSPVFDSLIVIRHQLKRRSEN